MSILKIIGGGEEQPPKGIGTVDDQVSQGGQDVLDILSYVKGYSFVEIDDKGISINTSLLKSKQDFLNFVNHIFATGLYFVGLNYDVFSRFVYDFSGFGGEKINISSGIQSISPERQKRYSPPGILSDGNANYTFSQLYDDIEEDGEIKEVKVILNIDEFVACMWNYGIKYGLQIDDIQDMISNGKIGNITIAKPRPSEDSVDAFLETLENFVPDKGLKSQGHTRVDTKNYNMTYPQVESGTLLYKKHNPIHGKYGMTIHGDEILSLIPKDISMNDFIGEGIEIEEKDGILYYTSNITGYVSSLYVDTHGINLDNKGKKLSHSDINRKLEVTTTLKISCQVGPKTGNIQALGDVECLGVEYGYELKGNNLTSKGDVSGNMFAYKDIEIFGNVVGGKHTGKLDNGDTQTILDGQVISEIGNIKVNGQILSRASIEALKGEVSAEGVESSIIAGKNVILKSARNSIIIGENIEITGEMRDCLIICTNTLTIQSAACQNNHENIILVIKPEDYQEKVKKISEAITKLQQFSSQNSQLLKTLQVESEGIKNNKNVKIFMGIHTKVINKQALTQQEREIYEKFLNWFQEQIKKLSSNQEQIKKLEEGLSTVEEALSKLSLDFEKLTQVQKVQINPSISVILNQSPMKLAYIKIPNYVDFDSLGKDVIEQLRKYKEFIKTGVFSIELIQTLFEGRNLSWNMKGNQASK